MTDTGIEREQIEIALLLEGIYRLYGFDFRSYAKASIRRRIWKRVYAEGLGTISALQERVLHEPNCMERLLLDFSVNVTELFRNPGFFLAFRQTVIPMLRTYPFIRIWVAGCATGEEAYTIAIMMTEEGLYDRCRIYATDMNAAVLKAAKDGIFPIRSMKEYTSNYLQAGGKKSFSEYYTAQYGSAILKPSLKKNMVFSQHNLVTDGSFNEFNVILCRNVMIYFNKELQDGVRRLLYESLCVFGFLGLGKVESLKHTPHGDCYEQFDGVEKIYRKVK